MIGCGIVDDNEAMLACFMGGLNKEIHTILEYKEYNNITRLFHLSCKAEREVQDQQALARTDFFRRSIFIMDTTYIFYFHVINRAHK